MATPHDLPTGVSIQNGPGGLPQLRLVTSRCEGSLYLHGAQVSGWTPAGGTPVLWLSANADFEGGKAIRGGIPLCGPWFAGGPDGDRSPSHGWLRLHEWQLDSVIEEDGDIVVRLSLDGRDLDGGGPLLARYEVRFGTRLHCRLTVEAIAAQTVELALHTYLAVSDVATAAVTGLEGAPYLERAGAQPGAGIQEGPARFAGAPDRIYRSAGPVALIDPERDGIIYLDKTGSANTVLWNPGEQLAATLTDIPPEGWRRFVCVEAADVRDDAISLAAGERATCAMTLSYEPA